MTVAVLIPARYASTRYPGKPLVELTGATGEARSLIRRSWEAARAMETADIVAVTTDDDRIATHCRAFGAEVVMTSSTCRNGTERCAEALARLGADPDIVINLQGDAPLTPPWFPDALVTAMQADPDLQVATPVLRLSAPMLRSFRDDRREGRVGGTTAVFDLRGRALYFSKEVVPYTGIDYGPGDTVPVFHHVGVYGYRPAALEAYMSADPAPLEQLEGLEQLRFMEHGIPVQCVEVEAKGREFWELNNPVDVARIERILADQGQP